MLKSYQKFRMMDKSKKNDFFIEINWNLEDEVTNDCKVFKITFPNGKESFIDKKHLLEVLFVAGSVEEKRQMIPMKLQSVHEREVKLSLKATKDIKKGEAINLKPIFISVPCDKSEEVIGELRNNGIIKPTIIKY